MNINEYVEFSRLGEFCDYNINGYKTSTLVSTFNVQQRFWDPAGSDLPCHFERGISHNLQSRRRIPWTVVLGGGCSPGIQ